MDKTADMVVVFGGVYFLMNFLREIHGDKPIIFMTPAQMFLRKEVSDLIASTHPRKLTKGKPLIDYVEVISQTAKQFGIHTLNLYKDLGIDPHNPKDFETYTMDGLHFNDKGHEKIATLLKFVESI